MSYHHHQQYVSDPRGTFQLGHLEASKKEHKWEVNITPVERFGRLIIGVAGAAAGILLLAGSPTILTGAAGVLLVAFGLDMIITGATGHCPLSKKLGFTPKSLKGENRESRA